MRRRGKERERESEWVWGVTGMKLGLACGRLSPAREGKGREQYAVVSPFNIAIRYLLK